MNELDFSYQWVTAECGPGVAYNFPHPITPDMLDSYSVPAVYRWAILDSKGQLVAVYFGETEDLVRRIGQYLKPGRKQQTNIRLKALFEEEIRKGSRIELQTLLFKPFSIRNYEFSSDELEEVYVRRMLENLVLTLEVDAGPQILNLAMKAGAKLSKEQVQQLQERLRKMTPEEKRALFQSIGFESEEP